MKINDDKNNHTQKDDNNNNIKRNELCKYIYAISINSIT